MTVTLHTGDQARTTNNASMKAAPTSSSGILIPMPKPHADMRLPAVKQRRPFEFVLDAIAGLEPVTRPMFGCLAVYIGPRIVLVLRDKGAGAPDNGVWLATTKDHHESLRREFPNMRSIGVLGADVTGWQILPAEAPDFEESALHACELVIAGDPRIGKVPKPKRSRTRKSAARPRPKP